MKDVHVEKGEFRKMRDPRTGVLKDVDLSLAALSDTMINIRKSAELINNPATSFDIVVGRFNYIEDLVLDHAQFSPKLANLEIKIFGKTIEVVKNVEQLQEAKITFIKKYYYELIDKELNKVKPSMPSIDKKRHYIRAQDFVQKALLRHIKEDAEFKNMYNELQVEIESL